MKRLAAAVVPAAALVLLAACSGGSDEPGADASSSSTSTSPSATPTNDEYIEVPDAVHLTEPGTELAFGEPAVIAWEPRVDQTAILKVSVDRVDRTSFKESFEGWVITDEMEGQTPLFVRLTVSNAGEERLGGQDVPLTVVDDTGIHVQPTFAKGETFEPCPGGPLPKKFKPGDETELCLLYLLDPGRTFTSVAFQPVDAEHRPLADAITWAGRLTPLEEPKNGGTKGQGKKGGQ
ncbi:MAG TPA: hypothetical protein VNS55_05180 [Nocardioides sp.]|nr:hypothetical protein [Nocardioides sp.]